MFTLIVSLLSRYVSAQWVLSGNTVPLEDKNKALGYYNNCIYLIGGYTNTRQLTTYNIEQDVFFAESSVLPYDTYGYGHYFAQSDHIVYMIDESGDKLSTFDLTNGAYTYYWENINIPINVDRLGCVVSVGKQLFFVGGGDAENNGHLDIVQILDLGSHAWISNTMKMNVARVGHGCVFAESVNMLFAIGGVTYGDDYLSSIEKVSITTLNNTWQFSEHSLMGTVVSASCLVHGNNIYVAGALYDTTGTVYIINVITGEVSLGESLAESMQAPNGIIQNNILYLFSGLSTDKWQYYNLPLITTPPIATATTLNPTFLTTAMETTEYITSHSTLIPTLSTSTIVPSFMASDSIHEATLYPTTNPVVYLTNIPSTNPSKEDSAQVEAAVTTRIPIATNNDEEISHISGLFSRDNALITIIAVVLLVIILSILCGIKRKKKKAVVQQIKKNLGGDTPKDICNPISPPNAATPNDQDVNDQDNEDSDDSDGLYEKQSGTTSGDNGTTRGNTEGEGVNKYEWIECRLKEYTDEWMTYLGNFKRHEIVDDLFSPPRFARTAPIWQELIPDFGVRIRFMDDVYS